MSFLWDSLYTVFERTRNYLVDPPGEENPENPELAITGEEQNATGDDRKQDKLESTRLVHTSTKDCFISQR